MRLRLNLCCLLYEPAFYIDTLRHFGRWLYNVMCILLYVNSVTLHRALWGFDPADCESVFSVEFLHIGSVIHSVQDTHRKWGVSAASDSSVVTVTVMTQLQTPDRKKSGRAAGWMGEVFKGVVGVSEVEERGWWALVKWHALLREKLSRRGRIRWSTSPFLLNYSRDILQSKTSMDV